MSKIKKLAFTIEADSTGATVWPEFPGAMIDDCAASGRVDDAVQYWCNRLPIEYDADGVRAYLRATGGWDDSELTDEETNLERIVWLICCDLREFYMGGE